ncbi:MAG: SpvB/TcaC N-terminal domain-containing protein, partial [Candidatus Promineifilaceae bacterium]
VMSLAETPATAADLQVAVSPLLAVKSEPPYPDGSQFRLTLALTNTQTARAPERLDRPFFLAFDVRTLLPEPPKDANWFVALRLPDDSGWSYPEMTVHDPAGLLSVPLNRGDYGQVVVGLQTAAASDTPQPWRYQWQVPAVSTFSGAATYQFPIEVPPGRAGLTPNIDISYSSSGLNGLAYTTGMDQGLLGLGWQINQIQITRRTVGLGGIGLDDQRVYPKHGNHFDLVINGSSHHLAHYRTEGNTYLFYAENAPGLRVRQIYAPGSSGINRDAVYWTVQTPDGTTYRLGYDENSETGQETQYVTVHMSGAQAEGNLTDYSGLRWMVDTITDVNGNQIQYDYEENWLPDEWYGHVVSYTSRITTSRTRPIQIRYNFTEPAPNADTRVNATAASKIEFVYTDTRVSQIKLYHLEATPYRIVDLVLDAAYYQEHQTCFDAKPDYEAYTLTVTGIRILNGDGSEALPETRFTYTPLRHIPEGNWYPTCFQFAHLIGVDNGYGGQVSFVYAPDGRHADTVKGNPEYAMSFIVQEVQYWDGVHANPARTAYSYSAPCYDQADGDPGPWDGAANCPSRPGLTDFTYPHGPLVGFDTTTAVHLDYDGQPVRTEVSSFWRGAGVGDDIRQRQGRPIQFQVYDTANNLV